VTKIEEGVVAGYVASIVRFKISYVMAAGKPVEKYSVRKNWV
jgi:hypothetical protein